MGETVNPAFLKLLTPAQAAGLIGNSIEAPINVTWAEIANTFIAALSDEIPASAGPRTFKVTAGSGVTNALVTVQAYTDAAKTKLVSLGSFAFDSPAIKELTVLLPYQGYVVNVIALTGGSISATVGASADADVGALTDPTRTGRPSPAVVIKDKWSIPIIAHGAGTVTGSGGNLTLTLTTPLDVSSIVLGATYVAFRAGELYSGSPAGLYYTVFSSTSVGIVYNNVLPANTLPTAQVAPTSFSGQTGVGAISAYTASDTVLLSLNYPGGIPGPNGALQFKLGASLTGSSNSVSIQVAGTNVKGVPTSASNYVGLDTTLWAIGSEHAQFMSANTNASDSGTGGNENTFALDLSLNYTVKILGYTGGATSNIVLMYGLVQVVPS